MRDAVSPNASSLLADLLAEITAAPPLQQLLERALDAACQLSHADTGAIGLCDAATDTVRTAVVRHAMPAPFQSTFARGEGLAGYIFATGKAYHGRYGDLPKPVVPALSEHISYGLPIRWQDQLLGHLALSVEPPRRFRPADLELVELIPPIIAIAIGHASRHDEELRGRRRFELIAHITADIHHHNQDLESLLQRAADAIHQMLQFPNVDIPLIDPADPQTLVVRVRGGDYKHRIQREDRL